MHFSFCPLTCDARELHLDRGLRDLQQLDVVLAAVRRERDLGGRGGRRGRERDRGWKIKKK